MTIRKLNPAEIVGRLQAIASLTADGWTVAEALRLVRVHPDEYEGWRGEYAGLLRTLEPLASASAKARRSTRRRNDDRRA